MPHADVIAVPAAQIDMQGAVNDTVRSIVNFVPNLLAFLVILLIGWLVAKVLRTIVKRILDKVGFDRVAERGGIKDALAESKYDAAGLIAAIVYYAVLLIALQIAFAVFGPNPVSDLIAGIVSWLPRAIVAIVIVVIAAAIARVVRDLLQGALGGLSYGPTLAKVTGYFIIALGVIAAINQIGIGAFVTGPVLIAVLATVGGILVVGLGGGLIRPMQERWERWITQAEQETAGSRAAGAGRPAPGTDPLA